MLRKIKSIINIAISILVFSTLVACTNSTSTASDGKVYQCPMKCEGEKSYDKPGDCPACKMDLVEVKADKITAKANSNVKIAGAMMNVMHKGELFGTILLDTIKNKKHLFGLGPIEYLKGEVLIVDGHSYISKVASDNTMTVDENYNVKAPFFVYENVEKWKQVNLPKHSAA
jgi:Heavy metal binding domain/Alpha-acetolactate decarboxylase